MRNTILRFFASIGFGVLVAGCIIDLDGNGGPVQGYTVHVHIAPASQPATRAG